MTYDLCPSLVGIEGQKTFRCESRFGVNIMAVFSHYKKMKMKTAIVKAVYHDSDVLCTF